MVEAALNRWNISDIGAAMSEWSCVENDPEKVYSWHLKWTPWFDKPTLNHIMDLYTDI